jgi:hypothetical protein
MSVETQLDDQMETALTTLHPGKDEMNFAEFPIAMLAVITLGLTNAGTTAQAGDYCPPPPCGHYETVLVKKCVEVPYTQCVTLYDHCGRPYQVEKEGVRLIEVTFRKRVFVRD